MTIYPGKEDSSVQHGEEDLEENKNILIGPADKGGAQ